MDQALSEAGYAYGPVSQREGSEETEEGHVEAFHRDPVRVVIAGVDGRVVRDNFAELSTGALTPAMNGHRETVFDVANNRPVGQVYVDVNSELLSAESHGFLSALLYITAIGGALTIIAAVLLAAWLSKRITAPVTALTEATQAISHGEMVRLPVASSDELGRMSAAFNRMTSTLDSQREIRRRLINDVSHELNTPLSVIMLEATGLRDGLQTPEDASEHIIEEVARLRGLVTDLDWLAETDHGELRLGLEPTPIHDLLVEEERRWYPESQARQVGLILRARADLPDADVDRMRMSQALGNILGNAFRCTEPGGSVEIQARLEGDETLAISVTDNGIGIHPADLSHVFDRFYRADQSRSRGVNGTGLGLAITKAIVEAHGGTVAITSNGPGKGTEVTVRIPVSSRDRQGWIEPLPHS